MSPSMIGWMYGFGHELARAGETAAGGLHNSFAIAVTPNWYR